MAQGPILTPDRRLRVFVSSTLRELALERAEAREAIASLRLAPILFEQGARPHAPRDLYAAYVGQCDVFIGIYWQSYGWIAPGAAISGIEDEFELGRGKPMLLYVKEPAPGREDGLSALIRRIEEEAGSAYRTFSTAGELRSLVTDDLAHLLTERFHAHADGPEERSALPARTTSFVGRDRELEEILRLLERTDVRLVTLTGRHRQDGARRGSRAPARSEPLQRRGVRRPRPPHGPRARAHGDRRRPCSAPARPGPGIPAGARMLEPRVLVGHLGSSLDTPSAGRRDAPARHLTMRATMDWSYGLLPDSERDLFERLGAFAGSFTIEAAQSVAGAEGPGVISTLSALADKSLLVHAASESETRFRMLQVVAEYARERLAGRAVRDALGEEAFGVAWTEGQALGVDASLEAAHRAVR